MIIARMVRAALAIFSLLTVWPTLAQAEPARWNVDPEHSAPYEFRVAHMLVSKTAGHFTEYQGFIDMDTEAETVKAIEARDQDGVRQHQSSEAGRAFAQRGLFRRGEVSDDDLSNEALPEDRRTAIRRSSGNASLDRSSSDTSPRPKSPRCANARPASDDWC